MHVSQCEWDVLLLWKAALASTPHTTKAIQDTRLSTHTSLSAVTSPPWLVHSRPLLMPRNSECGFVSHLCQALCTWPLHALFSSHTGFTRRHLLCLFFFSFEVVIYCGPTILSEMCPKKKLNGMFKRKDWWPAYESFFPFPALLIKVYVTYNLFALSDKKKISF